MLDCVSQLKPFTDFSPILWMQVPGVLASDVMNEAPSANLCRKLWDMEWPLCVDVIVYGEKNKSDSIYLFVCCCFYVMCFVLDTCNSAVGCELQGCGIEKQMLSAVYILLQMSLECARVWTTYPAWQPSPTVKCLREHSVWWICLGRWWLSHCGERKWVWTWQKVQNV